MSRLKVYDAVAGTWQYVGGVDAPSLAADPAFSSRYVSGANRPYYLDAYNLFFAGPWATGQGITSTTLTAQATAGAATMAVTSGVSFPNGTVIITNAGTATQQQYIVTSGGSTTTLTVTPNIVTTIANGASVAPLWTNSSHLTADGYTAFCYWFLHAQSGGAPIFTNPGTRPIVWLGDSWAANGAAQFTAQVAAMFPGATATNAGVSGNTSAQMLARFATDVPTNAAYVIINEPGVNDVYQAVPEATIAANLAALIAAIRAIGAVPVITGMIPLFDWPGQALRRSKLLLALTAGTGASYPGGADVLGALTLSASVTNTGFGANAQLNTLGTALNNTAVGSSAQKAQTTGTGNTAVGEGAQASITTGSNNTAIGRGSQQTVTTGGFNVAVGQGAQSAMSGATADNTAVGAYAQLSLTTGASNTHVGRSSGYSPNGVAANATTTGLAQTCVGALTGQSSATQQQYITCLGWSATAGGAYATALGSSTNANANGAVAIGRDNAGTGASTSVVNEIAVGTALHTLQVIGNASIGGAAKNVGFYGTTPIAKQTLAAAATDPATTMALVNDIRAKLIALGLFA